MAQVWQTVRIFISSTFRDMHAERDHLVRLVFPELRERCARRRLHLADVDLRWGVTEEETRQGKVLEICLDEIERCRPFFISLLGERYRWVPPKYEVTDAPRYDWVRGFERGHSITALEIYYGVLRSPDMRGRAFFYFRDPTFISKVPEEYRAMFLAESSEAVLKLELLKREIRKYCSVFENYSCFYSGIGAGGNVKLRGLEAFGEQVLEDLWLAITAEYPREAISTDELAIERTYHEEFIENRTRRFIGRSELIGQMTAYADSDNREPLLVAGAAGAGKSALLANFARKYAAEHPETFVLPHFIGVSPGSSDVRRTLLRLCRELAHHFDIVDEIPEDYEELRQSFAKLLEQAGSRGRVVLLLDALNQLDETHNAYALDWLPHTLPHRVGLIASTLEGNCLDALRRRSAPTEITVGTLAHEDRKDIVRQTLWESRKRLDERSEVNQMELLLKKDESDIPLYLIVACEELRLFGKFEQVTERIAGFPDDIPGLFQQVLGRLEADHGRELVEKALSLLECSRYGLLETEMLELLRRAGETQLPRALWARLYRSLQPYLHPPGESGDDALNFFHQQLSQAVRQRYLEAEEKEKDYHESLAIHFHRKADPAGDATWSGIYPRGLSELPYHQMYGEMWKELATIASDEIFILKQRQEVDMVAVDETLRLGIAAGLIVGEQRGISEVLRQRRRHFSAEQLGQLDLTNTALTRQELISLLQITRRLARPVFSPRMSLLLAWNALGQRQLDLCTRGIAQFIERVDGYLGYEEAHLFSSFFFQAWQNDIPQTEEAWLRAHPPVFAATSILRAMISLSAELPDALVALYQRLHQSAPQTVPSLPERPTLSEMENALAEAIKEELSTTTDPDGAISQLLKVNLDDEESIVLPTYIDALQQDLRARSGFSLMPGLLEAYQSVLSDERLSLELAQRIELPERAEGDATLRVAQAAELALLTYQYPDNRESSEVVMRRIMEWLEVNRSDFFQLGGTGHRPYRDPRGEKWTRDIQILLCIFAWARLALEQYPRLYDAESKDLDMLSLVARASRFLMNSRELTDTRVALASSLAREEMPFSLVTELLECHALSGLIPNLSKEEAWILGCTLNLTGTLSMKTRLAALNDESNVLADAVRSFGTLDVTGTVELIKDHLRSVTETKQLVLAAGLSAIWCGHAESLLPLIAGLPASPQRDLLYYAIVMQPEESNRLEYLPLIASPDLRFGAARLLGASTNRNAAYWQGVSGFKSTVLPFGDAILSVCEEETAARTATLFALNALHKTQ